MCGKIIGYQSGTPDGFFAGGDTIDGPYVDGVSLTHGTSPVREHIWTFNAHSAYVHCPCDSSGGPVPAFVGDNNYCGSEGNQRIWDDKVVISPHAVMVHHGS